MQFGDLLSTIENKSPSMRREWIEMPWIDFLSVL